MERSRVAATAAWIVPTAGVAAVGVLDRLELPATPMIVVVAATVAVGILATLFALAAGARRRALPGAIVCFAILSVATIAYFAGGGDVRDRAAARAHLQQQASAAGTEYPGWYGVATSGVRLFALQLDVNSELARRIAANFDRPISLLVVGVDNRAGQRVVELDLTEARLTLRDGSTRLSPPRAEILKGARSDELRAAHGGVYTIAPGTAKQNNLAFLSPDEPMQEVVAVSVKLDGRSVTIPGRYYTAEEKRAGAARGAR